MNMFNNNIFMDFLSEIWDLNSMPTTDDRFLNAYGDIYQHIINNNDWDYRYLFSERLNLLSSNELFQLFLENLVSPKYQNEESVITYLVGVVNLIIETEGYTLVLFDYYLNDLPIYKIEEINEDENNPVGIKINKIPFFVEKDPKGRFYKKSTHKKPTVFPAFILAYNDGWNDFSCWTSFYLFYYKNDSESFEIGTVKIIKNAEPNTINFIDDNFTLLDDSYCSLGQHIDYYQQLKNLLGKDFLNVLFALKDAAFFPDIQDKFDKNSVFNCSLIRENEQERLLREAKHIVSGADLTQLYQFEYQFKPCFSEISVPIYFKFDKEGIIPNRIYAMIGKNGTGKTQFISSLPLDISQKKIEKFRPTIPLFSKIIAVSYSAFDNFEIPKKTAEFNYVYCGLKDEKGDLFTERGQALRFHNTWKKIKLLGRFESWANLLYNFLEKEILEELIIKDEKDEDTVNVKDFSQIRRKMSSGQNILLYIISEIVANIRYDSLLLYDEPETHLHPNAISQLMNTIQDLVSEFQSYCIITTHSPIIIREIFSKSVYVIEKYGNLPSVKKIEIESFGENLSILNDIVFGNREIPKHYKKTIKKLVDRGLSYDNIIELMESDQIPLSLNVRIYIKSLTINK